MFDFSVARRLKRALAEHGIAGLLYRIYAALVDLWFDARYRVDTRKFVSLEQLHISGPNRSHGVRYEPARVVELRRLFRRVRQLVPDDAGMVDLGSGKGRMLMIAAECGFSSVTGVEFAAELCATARENCRKFQRRTGSTSRFTVVESDVVQYDIAPRDVVFVLFNPFDDIILRDVLSRLARSVEDHPRRVVICLHNTDAVDLVTRTTRFRVLEDWDLYGYRTTLVSNSVTH